MVEQIKKYQLLFYFIFSLFVMEILLRITTTSHIFSLGVLISFLFAVALGMLLFIVCSSFRPSINYILSVIFLAAAGIFFFSQYVYFQFFRTFYTLYSAMNATQVLEFWQDVWAFITQNLI